MRNFAAFILTHGRPESVVTYRTLARGGFTGKTYFIVDDEDATADDYRLKYGSEQVISFDKKKQADAIDEGNNFDNRKVIVHARNACFDIAEKLGVTHFVQLDDDYHFFGFRMDDSGAKTIKNLDDVFSAMCDFLDSTKAHTIAFAQGGDNIGGFCGLKMKRKAMNSFFCRTDRRFTFVGSINEDVNSYTRLGSVGVLFFTFTGLQLNQPVTQSKSGGMTDIYLKMGTYIKSFTSVLYCPSSVKVSMMGRQDQRVHHSINWTAACPMIVPSGTAKTGLDKEQQAGAK